MEVNLEKKNKWSGCALVTLHECSSMYDTYIMFINLNFFHTCVESINKNILNNNYF